MWEFHTGQRIAAFSRDTRKVHSLAVHSLSLPLSLLLVPLPESQSVYPSVFTHNKPLDNLCIPNGRDIIYLALP